MKHTLFSASLISFISVSAASAATVLIDTGSINFETTGNWNNVATNTGKSALDKDILDLIDDTGSATGFSLNSLSSAVGANEAGPISTTTGYPASATRDTFYIEGSESVTFTFSNLDAGTIYDFTFYAGRDGSGAARIANYEVIGGNKTDNAQLNALANVNNTVSLAGFTSDLSNEITINFTRASGIYAYVGVIQMDTTAIPEPSHYALAVGGLGLLAMLRRCQKRS
ncbi:hypothetical protein [Cerasicoccus arenae]|nr:hypothetical protein [Cerasicoccus arenae]MBK1857372.1 hypothetical protein [Cerasicoccus arenae]